MESVLHKIRFLYDTMGPGEKRIADYILQNTQSILGLSINDLADRCGSGDATVVRFSRRLGFSGYQAMKIGIAAEFGSTSAVDSSISREDSCFDIYRKRMNDIALSLQSTESVLSPTQLERAAQAIMQAGRVVIFGLGNSAPIAQDAAHKFLRLGLDAQACCDNHLQAIIASHLSPQTVAIGISHSGSSKDVVEALHLAKSMGATTICVTNVGQSPILSVSDIPLFTKAMETNRSILAMSSRIAQLTIFDSIYTYIVVNMDKDSMGAIHKTESALQDKKY
ncbi:MAG: MurR/RpiR family transcriptional regulator [Clostridia bacterium]|nr:MurR/RpiR family transcriptional regulator [Clostridia bacterium]